MAHLKFFQEHCTKVIDQQRPVVLAHHMLKNITWDVRMGFALIRICNNNSTFSRLQLMHTILLWEMEKLDLTVFWGSFSFNILCYALIREVIVSIQISIQIRV